MRNLKFLFYFLHSFILPHIHSEHKGTAHSGERILSSLIATLNSQCQPQCQDSRQQVEERKKWRGEGKGRKRVWSVHSK